MDDWQRTARVLWMVQFLTTLAMNLGLTFIPFVLMDDPVLAVSDPALRTLYTCLILGGPFVTTIVFTPLWGWVADRTGPKRQVVRACLGLGLTQLLMAIAQSPLQMVAIRIFQGVISGVLAASLGLIAAVTPREQQGRAIAWVQSATPAGQVLAPLLGGVLAYTLGYRVTYACLGTLILLTGGLSWLFLRQNGFVPVSSANPFVALYRMARRSLASSKPRQALGLLVAGQFAFTMAQGVFAIYATQLITAWVIASGSSPAWWNSGIGFSSLAFAITGLATVVSSTWWGRMHDRGVPFLTPLGAGLLSVSMLTLLVWPPWWLVLLSRIGVGVGVGATTTLQFAVLSRSVPPEERGQLMGLATATSQVGNLLGFLLGGVLAAWWSVVGNFALASLVYGFVVLAALRVEMAGRTTRVTAEPAGVA